ncbi:hypothetical protein AB0R12_30180 [Streptomyces niveus]|uniref:hypothetical protein n=1 Tax=Streptomyces niveus TaxID=193462 RepID=UPI00342EC79B
MILAAFGGGVRPQLARYLYEGTGDEFKDDFSVRYIDSAENQEAGRRLGAWSHSDRILNWEAFTVSIGD